jgi:hypothetical protein
LGIEQKRVEAGIKSVEIGIKSIEIGIKSIEIGIKSVEVGIQRAEVGYKSVISDTKCGCCAVLWSDRSQGRIKSRNYTESVGIIAQLSNHAKLITYFSPTPFRMSSTD